MNIEELNLKIQELDFQLRAEKTKNESLEKSVIELVKIKRVAACETAESFLKLTDEDKKLWFAMAIDDSTRRKNAEEKLEAVISQIKKPYCWTWEEYGFQNEYSSTPEWFKAFGLTEPDADSTIIKNIQPLYNIDLEIINDA